MSKVIRQWEQKKFVAAMSGRVAQGMEAACEFAAGQARAKVPRQTGRLADAVGYQVTAHGNTVQGAIGVTKRSKRAFIGYFVELGTSGHRLEPRQRRALTMGRETVRAWAEHPGTRPHPFLRPAVFGNAREIVRLIASGGKR